MRSVLTHQYLQCKAPPALAPNAQLGVTMLAQQHIGLHSMAWGPCGMHCTQHPRLAKYGSTDFARTHARLFQVCTEQ